MVVQRRCTNQRPCSISARTYSVKACQSPPKWAGLPVYINRHSAVGSQFNSPSATNIFSLLDSETEILSPLKSMSLASLRSWIVFFSESGSTPHTLLFSSSQEQRSQRSERSGTSELTLAQILRVSLSPQREDSPVLFFSSRPVPLFCRERPGLFWESACGVFQGWGLIPLRMFQRMLGLMAHHQ